MIMKTSLSYFGISTILASLLVSGCGSILDPYDDGTSERVPGISFISPAADAESADSKYTVQASFSSVILGDTWSLYYVSAATPNRGHAIFTGFSVTSGSIDWGTDEMPSGDYHLYGELISNGSLLTAIAPGFVRVDHSGSDNVSPSVSISSPHGGSS